MMGRPELALAAALAAASVLVTVLVYGPVSGGALLGFDGYPLIAASAHRRGTRNWPVRTHPNRLFFCSYNVLMIGHG